MNFALGTVQFGLDYGIANQRGQIPFSECEAILSYARASGFDTLDTAISYGNSEQRLGEVGIPGWRVVSKLPAIPNACSDIRQWIKTVVTESLRRLKQERLYGLLLHQPQQLFELRGDDIYRAVQNLKDNGIVQKIGVSVYEPSDLEAICSRYDIDLVQAPFNLFDQRLIESGWLNRLRVRNIELHTRSVFLQGLLLMEPVNRPVKFKCYKLLWARYDDWLLQNRLTRLQACLRFNFSFSGIDRIVVGVDSLRQLKEIMGISFERLPSVPTDLAINSIDVLNPTRWNTL